MPVIRHKLWRRVRRTIGNEYFESLFNKVSEAIALCDNRGNIIKINGEFRRMFGYTQQEAAGRSIDDLVAPQQLHSEASRFTQAAAQGEAFSTETLRCRKDGSTLHVSILGAPIHVHGRQVAVYGIYRNITDRKEAEQSLFDSQRQVLEINAALQQRTRQLEEANALLERLSNLV
jgi:PAS domain S-box-containing protein